MQNVGKNLKPMTIKKWEYVFKIYIYCLKTLSIIKLLSLKITLLNRNMHNLHYLKKLFDLQFIQCVNYFYSGLFK